MKNRIIISKCCKKNWELQWDVMNGTYIITCEKCKKKGGQFLHMYSELNTINETRKNTNTK